jgi:signal transduction histidine kinase/ligand-binding sensor domain-containing protein
MHAVSLYSFTKSASLKKDGFLLIRTIEFSYLRLAHLSFSSVKKCTIILLLLQLAIAAPAQEYFYRPYRVNDGLPSDIVKSCTQDSLGYFWIATDEGIAKYDGVKFTSYRAAMHSNYAKGFLTTRSGRLLAYGDLDLIEIQNLGDTVIFKSLCPVARIANDSTLSYPKLVFEDTHGDIWISESQSVVKLGNNRALKRYAFDAANRSPQFLRSFSFFEDKKHNLFISSFQGNLFRYNAQRDAFEAIDKKFPYGVEFVSVQDNKLIIGSTEGMSQAALLSEGGFTAPTLRLKVPFVAFVQVLRNQNYFVATRGTKHFIADFDKGIFTPLSYPVNNINHVYTSPDSDIWISGNEGLVMMKENLFRGIDDHVADFIESIAEDSASGTVYYATRSTLYAFDRVSKRTKVLLEIPAGYSQCLIFTKEGIWVANAFKVFLFSKGKIKKQFDFSTHSRFVTEITRDTNGNLWLAVPGNNQVHYIDKNLNLQHFNIPLGQEGVINMIREGKDGMYVASTGKSSYLFFKANDDSVFHNISVPVNFTVHGDFNVLDVVVSDNALWLATSEGLLKFHDRRLERVNMGERFTGLPVSSIHAYAGNKLLIANALGMTLYDLQTGATDLFNESSGLLSNTITPRGIFVDSRENVWVCTAKGLCYSARPLTVLSKTPQPRFTQVLVNGKRAAARTSNPIDYGRFLAIEVSSITFPENEVTFQYRFLPGDGWETTSEPELRFSGLPAGDHTLEVRAKKNGPFAWSDASQMHFTIAKPFWQRWWFYGLCFIGALTLVALTFIAVEARNQKKNIALQALIDERTNELRLSNEELVQLNQEKNNLIGVVAHDLRSPLRQMMGLLTLVKMNVKIDETSNSYLDMVAKSALRLDDMIIKILDVDAIDSQQLNVKIEAVDLSAMCGLVVDRFSVDALRKRISIVRKIDPEIFVRADKDYLEQVIENLLSNAIKFSPFERHVFVSLQAWDDRVTCEIRDQGPGLSEEDKKKLFGKYQKLSARPTDHEPSTGLGLSIVKKFVVAMNGEIACESEPGKGASFSISFVRWR